LWKVEMMETARIALSEMPLDLAEVVRLLATGTAEKFARPAYDRADALLTATVQDTPARLALDAAVSTHWVNQSDHAALIGFALGRTFATHAMRGNDAWLRAALALAFPDHTVIIDGPDNPARQEGNHSETA
jgi:hypothetical protein